jgi:ParB family chromosome partitioning protein
MRHDAHYVESLTTDQFKTFGRFISVNEIDPNPEQPRVDIGDLAELTASIADKGVLEPLLVRRTSGAKRWMIIAGERRWRAACAAGLEQVPCIEMSVDDETVAEIALIENIQRKDLTIWEEADALQSLVGKFGYTHQDIANKLGKSRTTITETLSLTSMPMELRRECQLLDISSKALLLQIVRQPTDEHMRKAISEHGRKRTTEACQCEIPTKC